MLLAPLLALTMALAGPLAQASGDMLAWATQTAASLTTGPRATFDPATRAVSNWRSEAAHHLDLGIPAIVTLFGGDERGVTRCVRLNNYWCIKRAGWAGEIAADAEGHVAFASAREGATVAALLLRRYYVVYGRRSAAAIVARWAPSACGTTAGVSGRTGRASADRLAVRGIGGTLRARFLAARGRGRVARARLRPSVVADRPLPRLPSPVIAIGLGTMTLPSAVGLGSLASLTPGTALPPLRTCTGDAERILAYARKASGDVTTSPQDDLGLFGADGLPTPNLAQVMANMAAVEIGPMKVDAALVEAGIADAVATLAARAAP